MTADEMRELLRNDPLYAAQELIGWNLNYHELSAQIVETEAYLTPNDPGCHAHRGMTPRNRILFQDSGLAYLYFTYGCHWMINVTAGKPGHAAAILIRAALPISCLDTMRARRPSAKLITSLLNGPGKLAAAFGLAQEHYGVDLLSPSNPLRLDANVRPTHFLNGPRVGLSKGCGEELAYRFADASLIEYVSNPRNTLKPLA